MKAKCIDDNGYMLTTGNIYDISTDKTFVKEDEILVKNNEGRYSTYPIHIFEIIKESKTPDNVQKFVEKCENDNYSELKRIFTMAVEQAENGKGKERHANDEPFEKQKICSLNRQIGSNHGLIYQACKKAIESNRLSKERAIAEILGAINYLAAAIILKEEEK